MQRGEVWWVNLSAPTGRRSVLLISRDSVYSLRTAITIAPITRTKRNIPSYVRLGLQDGMPDECVVSLDNILTIPKSALSNKITILSPEKMAAVTRAIAFTLGLKHEDIEFSKP